jgi:hypothetical protein
MSYTVTNTLTGKVEHIRAGRAVDAMSAYQTIRVAELNEKYKGVKAVSTSKVADAADGQYLIKNGEKECFRFNLFPKYFVPAVTVSHEYQDGTQNDWESGKFHS